MPSLHRNHSDLIQPLNSFSTLDIQSSLHDHSNPRSATTTIIDLTPDCPSPDDAKNSQFMSGSFFNYSNQQFENQSHAAVTPQPYSAAFYPQQHQQQQPQHVPREWQSYSGNYYNPDYMTQSPLSREQSSHDFHNAPHRRALSNSTNASQFSLQNYPTQNENLYQDQEYTQTPGRSAKHLPTPSHTPIQDSKMDQNYSRNKSNPTSYHDIGQRQLRNEYSSAGSQGFPSGPEFPATPRTSNGEDSEDQYPFQIPAIRQVPKFDRTMSDIYQDELYNPPIVTSAPVPISSQQNSMLLSPYRNVVMNERLQAANQARSASTSPIDHSRDVSPFRQDSPFAASSSQFAPTSGRIGTVAEIRSRQKAEADARAYRQHHPLPDVTEQNTISPKDALLDYPDADDTNSSLFPPPQSSGQASQKSYAPLSDNRQSMPSMTYNMPSSNFNFVQPTVPASASFTGANDTPKFGSNLFRPTSNTSSLQDSNPDYPAHLVSMETSASESADPLHPSPRARGREEEDDEDEYDDASDPDAERPNRTTADTGTYTCTYHGCSLRFETPARLQKHKREGHRSQHGHSGSISGASSTSPANDLTAPSRHDSLSLDHSGSATPSASGMTSAALLRNSQAGPHRCDRINPSTGKPCNTIFSRPYDLTRHEDTIHNAQKKKVRCQLCTEEKTFSRSDALTRHMRVVHPEVDFPGKHRRRGVD